MKFATKLILYYPPHLRHTKTSVGRIYGVVQKNCTKFNAP